MHIKAPKIVTILILSLITIVFWIGFEVYRIFTVKPAPPVPVDIIQPLDPTLDASALNGIQGKVYIDKSINIAASAVPTPSPVVVVVPSPAPVPTPAASPSVTPAATP